MTPVDRHPTFVVGHRNPDADAICSAIAYAAYKEARGESGFVAAETVTESSFASILRYSSWIK